MKQTVQGPCCEGEGLGPPLGPGAGRTRRRLVHRTRDWCRRSPGPLPRALSPPRPWGLPETPTWKRVLSAPFHGQGSRVSTRSSQLVMFMERQSRDVR